MDTIRFATPGEELFATFLNDNGIEFDYEPLLGSRRPDFLVRHPEQHVVAEIYEPLNPVPDPGTEFDAYKVVRSAFLGRKKKQRIAAKSLGLPFLLVIATGRGSIHIPPEIVAGAMFGDIRPNKSAGNHSSVYGFGPTFSGRESLRPEKNRSMSAVATLGTVNPYDLALNSEFELRIKNLTDERLNGSVTKMTLETLHTLQTQVVTELIAKGKYQPGVNQPVLTILHNPFARHPIGMNILDGTFVSQWSRIDNQYGSVKEGSGLPTQRGLTIGGLDDL
jgi:hypothetical protein